MARKAFQDRCMAKQKAPSGHIHLAFCVNYVGTAFRGLQIQTAGPTHHTVEGVLLQAMNDIGLIDGIERGRPRGESHHFARSCRTDRGVHAIRNVISIFVTQARYAASGHCDGIREKLNAVLLPEVHVAKVSVVLGSFIPRNCCNRRVYRYLIPAYALLAPADGWASLAKYYAHWETAVTALAAHLTANAAPATSEACGTPFLNLGDVDRLPDSLADAVSPMLQALSRSVCKSNEVITANYLGFHRFHNFCVDVDPQARQHRMASRVISSENEEAGRVIYRCEILPRVYLLPADDDVAGASLREYQDNCALAPAEPPSAERTMDGKDRKPLTASAVVPKTSAGEASHLPFLLFQIEGGSFLFNMIRKMVGALLAVCRGASEDLITQALSPERTVATPLAPGAYLFLALSTYHGYDTTVEGMNARQKDQRERQQGGRDGVETERADAAPLPTETIEDRPNASVTAASTAEGTKKEKSVRPLREEWSGGVASDCERFVSHVIARDIVDVDLQRLPSLDEMLSTRDRARRTTRPQWIEEDAHLAEMKEYTPSEEIVRRNRAYAKSPAKTAPVSEMTAFLRLLRVHNWSVKTVPLLPHSKAMLEVKNKRARKEEAAAAEPTEVSLAPEDEVLSSAWESIPDGGEDGWVYPGPTEAEEKAQRQASFAARWKRSRPWAYTVTNSGVRRNETGEDGDSALSGATA